jgi:hypothetical protein
MSKLVLVNSEKQPVNFSKRLPMEGDFVKLVYGGKPIMCYVYKSTSTHPLEMISVDNQRLHWDPFVPEDWVRASFDYPFEVIEPGVFFTLQHDI